MDLAAIQSALRERNIDAWLFCDHHHRDPIAYRVLGLPTTLMVTRRWFYLIPAEGEPLKLVHKIEAGHLDSLPGKKASVLRMAGTVRQTEGDVGQPSRSRDAVLPEQHHLLCFAGRWRHDRSDPRAWQERRQFGRPGGAVRSDLDATSRSSLTSRPATASIPSSPRRSRKLAAACAMAAPKSTKFSSGSWKRSRARTS